MKPGKATSVEELQVVSRFEGLRNILLSQAYTDHLDKPLAYWALPSDRQLPLAFLGRTLRDLLNTPFAELAATPGVGRKKTASFLHLLARAANTDASQLPSVVLDPSPGVASATPVSSEANVFDPNNISEVTWAQWRATVVRHGLTHETLGRLAPTLKHMTRVIWNRPLGDYVHLTLDQIRSMKTHGEKRIHAILDVFRSIHELMVDMGSQNHLVVRIVPRRIDQVEAWIGRALQSASIPTEQEIFNNYVQPLLDQIHADAAQQIAHLAENRLGLHGPITSVRQAARTIGLTRARVYQLLNEINDIMMVRWPTGRHQSYELCERCHNESVEMENAPDFRQFFAAVELFYPGSRRGADGAIETIGRPKQFAAEDELVAAS